MGANHSDILLHNRVLDGSWKSKFNEAFNTSFAHIKNDLLINEHLTYLTLVVQKVKISYVFCLFL